MDRRTYIRRWIDPVLDLYARSINLSKEFSALPWLMVTIDACFSASIVCAPFISPINCARSLRKCFLIIFASIFALHRS